MDGPLGPIGWGYVAPVLVEPDGSSSPNFGIATSINFIRFLYFVSDRLACRVGRWPATLNRGRLYAVGTIEFCTCRSMFTRSRRWRLSCLLDVKASRPDWRSVERTNYIEHLVREQSYFDSRGAPEQTRDGRSTDHTSCLPIVHSLHRYTVAYASLG